MISRCDDRRGVELTYARASLYSYGFSHAGADGGVDGSGAAADGAVDSDGGRGFGETRLWQSQEGRGERDRTEWHYERRKEFLCGEGRFRC